MLYIIIVSGFATGLQSILQDMPKPMAPIDGKPFLAYLLDYLAAQGITKVIFSVHHLREKIQDYFGDQYQNINISYAIEDEPLGTGGAIMHSLTLHPTNEPTFVLNGDTFVKLDYQTMYERHLQQNKALTMALRVVDDCMRYGKVIVEQQTIT